MVLSTKIARDLMKTSGLANKKAKNSYKGHKKDNYKKKQKTMNECCICYEKVEVCKDNTITCNTTNHTICRGCKVQMKGGDCPMCRSHPVKQPVDQMVKIKILQKPKKSKGKSPFIGMSPKQKRNYVRSGPYWEPFGPNTNRLVRQRKNCKGYTSHKYFHREENQFSEHNNTIWLTEEQVLRYNGSLQTQYDSASDSSEDTLSLTSDSDSDSDSVQSSIGSIQRIVNGWLEEDEEEEIDYRNAPFLPVARVLFR